MRVRSLDAATWPDFAGLVWCQFGPTGELPRIKHLHNGTVAMFERHGLERTRRIGKHRWVVAKVVR